MRHTKRKGFTIVELVIVIAVIGILSAILIPTFVNITASAKNSSDRSFVRNANTGLAMGGTHKTMYEAITDAEKNSGLDLQRFKPSQGTFVWDSKADRFAIVGTGYDDVIIADSDFKAESDVDLFYVCNEMPANQRFSIYAGRDWAYTQVEINNLKVGFDAGENDIRTINYDRSGASDHQSVIIATQKSPDVVLTVNAEHDDVAHFGFADTVIIEAVAPTSYHEHGIIAKPIVVNQGNIVLEPTSSAEAEIKASATCEIKAGSTSTASYVGHAVAGSVQELRLPGTIAKRKARTANLDHVETIKTNKNPDRNTFYHNGEAEGDGVDSYKVGRYGTFKLPIYAATINNFKEQVYKCPAGLTWSISDGETTYTNNDNSENLVAYHVDTGEMTFKDGAIGKSYTFTAALSGKAISFNFDVIDAYNVYDAKTLSAFDNRSILDPKHDEWTVRLPENSQGEYDIDNPQAVTGLYVKSQEVKNNSDRSGVVLHEDIVIRNSDLPDNYFYTEQDVAAYLADKPNDLRDWLKNVNENRISRGQPEMSEREGLKALVGSIKDDRVLFYHIPTPEENYVFEGNYFGIDASNLKLVRFFGNRHNNNNSYDKRELGAGIDFNQNSRSSLFAWNCVSPKDYQERGFGGTSTVRNLAVTLNGGKTDDNSIRGSLYGFKVDCTEVNFENVIVSKAFSAYFSQVGQRTSILRSGTLSGGKNVEFPGHCDILQERLKDRTLQAPFTEMNLDRCKTFDSYNALFYIYGTQHNRITNSIAMDCGGAAFILDERNKHYYWDPKYVGTKVVGDVVDGYQVENKLTDLEYYDGNYWQGDPRVECANVHFENYVTGEEPWFRDNGGKMVGTLLNLIRGSAAGWMNSVEVEGKKSFIRGSQINMVAMDLAPQWFAGVSDSNPGRAPKGHFKVFDTVEKLAAYVANPSAPINQENGLLGNLDMNNFCAATPNPAALAESIYREVLFGGEMGAAFFSTNGGHGMPGNILGSDGGSLEQAVVYAVFDGTVKQVAETLVETFQGQGLEFALEDAKSAVALILANGEVEVADLKATAKNDYGDFADTIYVAIHAQRGTFQSMYAAEVEQQVTAAAAALTTHEVGTGDSVVGKLATSDYMSCYINFGKGPHDIHPTQGYINNRLAIGLLLGME